MNLYNRIINKILISEYQLIYDTKRNRNNKIDMPLNFHQATVEDIEIMRSKYPEEFSKHKYDLYKEKLNNKNNIIIISKTNEEISGYFNISFENTLESGINKVIEVREKEAYFYDDYVFKAFRGNGIQKKSILYRIYYVMRQGKERIYVNVYKNNKPSLISYKEIGFNIIRLFKRNKITNKLVVSSIKRGHDEE